MKNTWPYVIQRMEAPHLKSQRVNKATTALLSPFTSLITLQDSTTTATPRCMEVCVSV